MTLVQNTDDTTHMTATRPPLLDVRGLSVTLPTGPSDSVHAVKDVRLTLAVGERVGIVGESGSGKSVTGRAIAGLLPGSPRVKVDGSIRFDGTEMIGAPPRTWDAIRRSRVSMIFQDPLSFLNPTMRVGRQIREGCRRIVGEPRGGTEKVYHYMTLAGLNDVETVARKYPFELSGGMRQRVLIAIALAKQPEIIIADEPTTALDVTVQRLVLETLDRSVSELGTSLIMITHDLAVVAKLCERVYVMYAGRVVEHGLTKDVFTNPAEDYTRGLLRSVRSLTDDSDDLVGLSSPTTGRIG
ncbi:hypothetical protein GCM10022381_28970 [Leifsonia kafniensis]|uniref:ABC transporter domain-containing protein n=1 Tax=Leifsonia kafniensis TaxID=475957 RepID=A0ABP7KR88_9MICO